MADLTEERHAFGRLARRLHVASLACVACLVACAPSSPAGRGAREAGREADRVAQVRDEIQARYARQADAYARRDADTFIENLEPDFVAEPLRGPRADRARAAAAVRSRMARVEEPRITVTIDSLRVAGDTAEVYSEQLFTRTVRDAAGAPRAVVSTQRHLERWRRTPRGWRIFYLRELGGAEAVDGAPPRVP